MSRDSGAGAYVQSAGIGARSCFRSSSVTCVPSLAASGRDTGSPVRSARQTRRPGEGLMRSRLLISTVVLAACAAIVTVAGATNPGSGGSTGSAMVFVPNPVQSLGDESLTDQKDADSAVPAAAYHAVTLTNLDGSGFLHGDYATVYSSTGNQAYSPTNTFAYTRHQDEFEQVMAYYWITEAQKYIHSLGFGVTRPGINNQPQKVRINQYGADNSFETDQP